MVNSQKTKWQQGYHSVTNFDQISVRIPLMYSKFCYSNFSLIVFLLLLRWVPKWSCGRITPLKSLLNSTIRLSTRLKVLRPSSSAATKKASRLSWTKYSMANWILSVLGVWDSGFDCIRNIEFCHNDKIEPLLVEVAFGLRPHVHFSAFNAVSSLWFLRCLFHMAEHFYWPTLPFYSKNGFLYASRSAWNMAVTPLPSDDMMPETALSATFKNKQIGCQKRNIPSKQSIFFLQT